VSRRGERCTGADGHLLKDMEPEDILVRLQEAMQGRLVISPRLTELLACAARAARPDQSRPGLTARGREPLELIAEGLNNKLIARELEHAIGTVKAHVKHLLQKLGLHNRVEANAVNGLPLSL
jgi:two-component system nitrate/nitrite response regulator NarL